MDFENILLIIFGIIIAGEILFSFIKQYFLDNPKEIKSLRNKTYNLEKQYENKNKEFAKRLHIEYIEELEMGNYPCIKCNLGATGEKIYHLPFDQQYDATKIEPHKGEFYALTVKEAEDAGFRRAHKYFGS